MDKKRILFVDDDARELQSLRRRLVDMDGTWEMVFATSASTGLAAMATTPFDIVVSDLYMPRMDGSQFLTQVRRLYPRSIRFVLSDPADKKVVLHMAGLAHQFLAKPCDADMFRRSVERSSVLQAMLANAALQKLVSSLESLPVMPSVFTEIRSSCTKPNTNG